MFAVQRMEFAAAGRFSNTKMLPPEKWLPALAGLMEGYQKTGAIRSLDALLMALCQDDAVAALMLKHVLEWQPRAIREDGAIWRSADEWMQYTRLTRSMVYNGKRRERLHAAGIKVWVERAMGENTLHFKVDAAKLTASIAAALGMNYNIALIKLWQVIPIEVSQEKTPIPFPKTGSSQDVPRVPNDKIPLTESSTEDLTDKTSSVLLNSISLSVEERAKYGVLAGDVVQKIFDTAQAMKEKGKLKKNPLAYLRGALNIALEGHLEQAQAAARSESTPLSAAQSDSTPPPPLNPLPVTETPPRIQGGKPTGGTVPSWARDLGVGAEVPMVEMVVCKADEKSLREWEATYNQLELQLDYATFETWMRGAKLVDVDDGVFVVQVRNEWARNMLQHRLYRNVHRVLRDVRSQATEIRFVIGG